jgi:hypothetical protein
MGPFVDATNSRIKDGDMDETPQRLFERQFTERLQDFLVQSPGSTVLLVPSINDVISDHAVFPQCELEPEFSKDPVSCTCCASSTSSLTTNFIARPPTSQPLPLLCQWDFVRSDERRYVVSSSQGGIL